jgi:hypothetical protein
MARIWMRTFTMLVLLLGGAALADKPERIPVAMGAWKGPHAGSFKSGVRSAIGKDCVVVKAEKARVIVEGEVTPSEDGKKVTVKMVIKSPKTNEIVESKEYSTKPDPSVGQSKKMGHDLVEMARRAPTE